MCNYVHHSNKFQFSYTQESFTLNNLLQHRVVSLARMARQYFVSIFLIRQWCPEICLITIPFPFINIFLSSMSSSCQHGFSPSALESTVKKLSGIRKGTKSSGNSRLVIAWQTNACARRCRGSIAPIYPVQFGTLERSPLNSDYSSFVATG